jgi:AcrR family transcriptional regulator
MILDTAAAMLVEMPVAQVSLNELSRRVGLAKSNVLRYFESREAVLLELLDAETRAWLAALESTLSVTVDAGPYDRAGELAASLAASLAERPVLCELLGAQAAVLEHNVSPEVAAQYKRAMLASVDVLRGLVRRHVPELGADDGVRFAGAAAIMAGALWTHSQPSEAMLAAYAADPELAALRLDFTATLQEFLGVLLTGLLARAGR